MKLIRFPRLSLSFPLLLLGVVVLPLLLEERNSAAAGELSKVSSCPAGAEEAPDESGDKGGEQQEEQDAGTPASPHAAGGIPGEALQVGGLQAEPVPRPWRAADSGGSLPWVNETLSPLGLETDFSSGAFSVPFVCIPAGAGQACHPVRGPPAS